MVGCSHGLMDHARLYAVMGIKLGHKNVMMEILLIMMDVHQLVQMKHVMSAVHVMDGPTLGFLLIIPVHLYVVMEW